MLYETQSYMSKKIKKNPANAKKNLAAKAKRDAKKTESAANIEKIMEDAYRIFVKNDL